MSLLPIELAHFTAWAERLQTGLAVAYPRTLWLVLDHDDLTWPLPDDDVPRCYTVMAMTRTSGRYITANVPFTLVVDEEAFALVVIALGGELERRLAA